MSFFGRVIQNFMQQELTKFLARSSTFQRMARGTVDNVQRASRVAKGEERLEFKLPSGQKAAPQPKKPTSFIGHLVDEVKRDMRQFK